MRQIDNHLIQSKKMYTADKKYAKYLCFATYICKSTQLGCKELRRNSFCCNKVMYCSSTSSLYYPLPNFFYSFHLRENLLAFYSLRFSCLVYIVMCTTYNLSLRITLIFYTSLYLYFSLYPLHSESSAYGRYAIALTTTRPLLHNTNNVPNGVAQKALWLCFFVVLLP